MRTWVSPSGSVHDVSDDDLYRFCNDRRKLHYQNMVSHISKSSSDQKNGGWRLIERLRAIGHVDRPHQHVLALGTLEQFHKDCLAASDGRASLKSRDNLGKLLNGRYNGGKPWNGWECRHLSTAEKRHLLEPQSLPRVAPTEAPAPFVLPDYASVLGSVGTQFDDAAAGSSPEESSALEGRQEAIQVWFSIFSAPPMRSH